MIGKGMQIKATFELVQARDCLGRAFPAGEGRPGAGVDEDFSHLIRKWWVGQKCYSTLPSIMGPIALKETRNR
jgi:hypothetical protein